MDTAAITDTSAPKALTTKEPVNWGLAIAQVITVAFAYVVASTLPVLPETIMHIQAGNEGDPEFSSLTLLSSVMLGMLGGLTVAWAWLKHDGHLAQAWNFARPDSWRSTLGWATIGLVGTIVIFTAGAQVVEALGLPTPDATFVLDAVTESPLTFVLWIVGVAILAAGFGEEMLWRGFLMDRMERLAGLKGQVWLIVLIQAVLFGLPHAYQGAGGMIITGSVGLLLGWIRIKQRGNLWAVCLAHAAVDVVMMSLAYAGELGYFPS
ncbi:MAG: CPBP family intramembrane glutamic endopeptidase [Alteraurantiacibacter sp.]